MLPINVGVEISLSAEASEGGIDRWSAADPFGFSWGQIDRIVGGDQQQADGNKLWVFDRKSDWFPQKCLLRKKQDSEVQDQGADERVGR